MTVASGKAKYAAKAQVAVAKYNAAKGDMPGRWAAGLAEAGAPPGPISQQAYQAGISAGQYRMGNPDKWERNFRAGIGR